MIAEADMRLYRYVLSPHETLELDIQTQDLRVEIEELLLPLMSSPTAGGKPWRLSIREGLAARPSAYARHIVIGRGAGGRAIPGWLEESSEVACIIAEETRTSTRVDPVARRIQIEGRATPYHRPHIRQTSLSIAAQAAARHLLTAAQARCGAPLIHGACVRPPGRDGAVVLIGDKGAGKTTMMLQFLAAGADFIAPDRVFLHPTVASCEAWAFPDTVRVTRDSLDLAESVVGRRLIAEDLWAAAPNFAGKRQFASTEFLSAFGGKTINRAPVSSLILLDRSADTPSARAVRPGEAAALLRMYALSEGRNALPQPLLPDAMRSADWAAIARSAPLLLVHGAWPVDVLARLILDG